MATSGRSRGGRRATRRSNSRAVAKAGGVEKLDQVSLSTFCAPTRLHLLVAPVRAPIAAATSKRRR